MPQPKATTTAFARLSKARTHDDLVAVVRSFTDPELPDLFSGLLHDYAYNLAFTFLRHEHPLTGDLTITLDGKCHFLHDSIRAIIDEMAGRGLDPPRDESGGTGTAH